MPEQQNPLILTLRLDAESQLYFDDLRNRYFPPERNFLKAHLTLFHQLPNFSETREFLDSLMIEPFGLSVNGLRHLGAGVAFTIASDELEKLHRKLRHNFADVLIPQDKQPFRPHITIQNKVTPEASKKLLLILNNSFEPFTVQATGLDLWEYLGGPWRHSFGLAFKNSFL